MIIEPLPDQAVPLKQVIGEEEDQEALQVSVKVGVLGGGESEEGEPKVEEEDGAGGEGEHDVSGDFLHLLLKVQWLFGLFRDLLLLVVLHFTFRR